MYKSWEKQSFVVKEEHLKLLKNVCISWQNCEFGAPEINPKRPYGYSNVIESMAEILGIKENEEYDAFSKTDIEKMERLHQETEVCLHILTHNLSIHPGLYVHDAFGDWVFLGNGKAKKSKIKK